MKLKKFSIVLDVKRLNALKRISKAQHRSVSSLVRQGLQEMLKKK